MDLDGIFFYHDEHGENLPVRAKVNADGFTYLDENGKVRAQLGAVETVAKRTGKESRYPAGVALFDEDGDVIWMAPN